MHESPTSATPYEVLGVSSSATDDELKRAYRRMLRETHPDAGGDAARFHAVQVAWEKIGTSSSRSAYDRGTSGQTDDDSAVWATARTAAPRRDTRPSARSYGHPGGLSRERFLDLMREWSGRGADLGDPYEPGLVRSAPTEIRHALANALAEEATARTLSTLGIAFTIWHDVATDAGSNVSRLSALLPKLDHLVLGPSGLYAIASEDWGGEVRVRRGELIGEALAGERPMHALALRAKSVAKAAKVKVTALLIVVPDDASAEGVEIVGSSRGAVTALVQRSRLAQVLRDGLPGAARIGGTDLMEVRTRLQQSVRFA
ncbi:J domain-containing protein [Agromyces atrinae]|uniref:J domain-containing protein n=1 Tax=Agromyces atrinae TaxID=592376 RepID=UPI001F58A900|nr:J domain-containing protein [Agromyces atrinae]MCI2959393.1 J domain-containing protein [Agromyces atrinae]